MRPTRWTATASSVSVTRFFNGDETFRRAKLTLTLLAVLVIGAVLPTIAILAATDAKTFVSLRGGLQSRREREQARLADHPGHLRRRPLPVPGAPLLPVRPPEGRHHPGEVDPLDLPDGPPHADAGRRERPLRRRAGRGIHLPFKRRHRLDRSPAVLILLLDPGDGDWIDPRLEALRTMGLRTASGVLAVADGRQTAPLTSHHRHPPPTTSGRPGSSPRSASPGSRSTCSPRRSAGNRPWAGSGSGTARSWRTSLERGRPSRCRRHRSPGQRLATHHTANGHATNGHTRNVVR